jgi:clan AA aspartic protease (TIGR02281 family)
LVSRPSTIGAPVNRVADASLGLLGLMPLLVAFVAMFGVVGQRSVSVWVVVAVATLWCLVPPVLAAAAASSRRMAAFGAASACWAVVLLFTLPLLFTNGEAESAARSLVAGTPLEVPPMAEAVVAPDIPSGGPILSDNQIALPYDGTTHRAVPVVFEHAGNSFESYMMLDTGATYTTLSPSTVHSMGIDVPADAPRLTLHTANGDREALLVMVDRVWLGNLAVEGVAIAMCEDCGSSDTKGLLGLNVSGGFNVNIDADRKEVVFTARAKHDRRLDVKPFINLSATFARYPRGAVEVEVIVMNSARRPIGSLDAVVSCGDQEWTVALGDLPAQEVREARRRLPDHGACESYRVALGSARW